MFWGESKGKLTLCFSFFNTWKVHKLPPGKQFVLKVVFSAILPTYPYYLYYQLNVLPITKKKITPAIVDSAEEEAFEDEEVYDEDETDGNRQL